MLSLCRRCVYFSKLDAACFKFGKEFFQDFYSATECRRDEKKCGKSARYYLEDFPVKKKNEVEVHDSPAYDVGR